jgi:hypothetical protein
MHSVLCFFDAKVQSGKVAQRKKSTRRSGVEKEEQRFRKLLFRPDSRVELSYSD